MRKITFMPGAYNDYIDWLKLHKTTTERVLSFVQSILFSFVESRATL